MNSLGGVSILEKGTMNGTITQLDGTYSIELNEGATLVFSFIGFEDQEVPVEERSTINVVMQVLFTLLMELKEIFQIFLHQTLRVLMH